MFVEDITIIGLKNIKVIVKFKIELITFFDIIEIRPISFYLDVKVEKDYQKRIIKLS